MATDLNVAQLLEISKVEGLDENAVLQSMGAHGDCNAILRNGDVFVDDPPPPPPPQPDQPQLQFLLHHKPTLDLDLDQHAHQSAAILGSEPNHPHSQHHKLQLENKLVREISNINSEPNQLDCEEHRVEEPIEADLPHHEDNVDPDELVSEILVDENQEPLTHINEAHSNHPAPQEEIQLPQVGDAFDSGLHPLTHGQLEVNQDKSVSDVLLEENTEPVIQDMDITAADSNQPEPTEEKKLPEVVEAGESDLLGYTHSQKKVDQDISVSDVIEEQSKEPFNETTDIRKADSNQLDPKEERVKEEKQLPQVVEPHRLTHGEKKADQDESVADVILEENREPVIETTNISEADSNHSTLEEKVEEENKLSEVAEAVEPDLHQLTHGKEKVNKDISVPDVIVEEHTEPVIASMDIVEPESNQPCPGEVKVEDEKKAPQVVEAVESDLHQLAQGEEKVEDQSKFECDSESLGSQVLISQTNGTDSLDKSELHHLHDGDNKVGEINEVGTHIENQENESPQLPIVEACEPEPLQVCIEEETKEQSKLESSADVCQDDQISTREAVESDPSRHDDVKECKTGTSLEISGGAPSTHVEAGNLESEMVTCPSTDLLVEMEAKSITNEVTRDLTSSAVEQTVLEAEILNATAEDQKKGSTCIIGQNESEPQNVNGHAQNTENSVFELKSETDVKDVTAESGKGFLSNCDASTNLESEAAEVLVERHESKSPVEDLKSEAELGNGRVEGNQSTAAITIPDLDRETNPGSSNLSVDPVDDTQSKSGAGNNSESLKMSTTGPAKLESLISNGHAVKDESNPDSINNVKSTEIEGVCEDSNGKSTCEGNGIVEIGINGGPSPSPENSTIGSLEGANVDSEVEKKPFRFLIRIPRYNDDKIKNQIDLAQKKVEEKTRNRDVIRSTIQSRRVTCGEYRDTFEAARSEERAARDALNVKRREMDSVQSVISRKKNANSVEDIDDRIRIMEHRIEHETVPLKEEKQLIREIKQMKNLREQLSSSLGQQAEIEPTSEERVKLEERYKPLKQEIEHCRREVSRLEEITRAAWKICFDENEKLKELQAQFRAADDLRQEAYIELQNLKKQLYEKNKYFRMYKEDAWKAEDYSSKGDREAVHNLCVNQVERIMELWNKSDEFRNEYIRCNTMSTLRRLRTLDGRSLGPDEEPPLLRYGLDERVDSSLVGTPNKIEFPLLSSSQGKSAAQDMGSVEILEQKNHKLDSKSVLNLEQKNLRADSKSVLNLEQIYPVAKSQKITKSAGLENIPKTVSGSDEKQDNDEEIKRAMEEEILTRKAEELRKEKEAAKLKEQRRLEEKAKAKEAEERKRRTAEKAQARAELRAQKEAELREKEREKKARKKERKMAEATTGGNETESSSRSESTQPETTQEAEIKEKPKTKTVGKRPQKASLLSKQIKPKAVPPPLRNRSKKRMQQWVWILLVVVVVSALFVLGNGGFSFEFGWSRFSF